RDARRPGGLGRRLGGGDADRGRPGEQTAKDLPRQHRHGASCLPGGRGRDFAGPIPSPGVWGKSSFRILKVGEERAVPLQIHTVVSEPFAENSYVVWRDGGTEAFVVDPGYEPEAIRE